MEIAAGKQSASYALGCIDAYKDIKSRLDSMDNYPEVRIMDPEVLYPYLYEQINNFSSYDDKNHEHSSYLQGRVDTYKDIRYQLGNHSSFVCFKYPEI